MREKHLVQCFVFFYIRYFGTLMKLYYWLLTKLPKLKAWGKVPLVLSVEDSCIEK